METKEDISHQGKRVTSDNDCPKLSDGTRSDQMIADMYEDAHIILSVSGEPSFRGTSTDPLPVYLPKPKVCHMTQYHCCHHRDHCRLYSVCSQIQLSTVCQRDCPTCTYEGCSLDLAKRQTAPVYRNQVIQGDRFDLNLERRYQREKDAHLKKHKQLYYFYNCLWGDYRQKRNISNRRNYQENIEVSRAKANQRQKKRWRKLHPVPAGSRRIYYPPCGLKCDSCPHDDCILPPNWEKQLQAAAREKRDPGWRKRYYQKNKERLNAYGKDYYRKHKDAMNAKNKSYREDPAVKAHIREQNKKYRETHQEQIRAQKAAWYQKHKDEINARRRKEWREKHDTGRSAEHPAHRQVR